jgi:hypothetical protein
MSDGYEGREIALRAYRATDQTINTNNSTVKVQFSNVDIDTTNSFNTSNNSWVCPSAGYYRISTNLRIYGNNVLNNFYIALIRINGSTAAEGLSTPFTGSREDLICNDVFYLKAGDTVEIHIYGAGNNSSNAYFIEGGSIKSYLSIFKIQSPQSIATNEIVAARYTSASGQTIPNVTSTVVNFNTKEYDTHNAVTTGTNWKFTAPVAGFYNVSSHVLYSSFTSGGIGTVSLSISKNGSFYCDIGRSLFYSESGGTFKVAYGLTDIRLNAGDEINISTYNNSGASRTLYNDSNYVWVAIHKVS